MSIQQTITDLTGKQHTIFIRQSQAGGYYAHLGDYEGRGDAPEEAAQRFLSGFNHNHPAQFDQLNPERQEQLLSWVVTNLKPGMRGKARRYSSYYLKHVAERMIGDYVGNGEMKGAMLKAGYSVPKKPEDSRSQSIDYAINWEFVLERGLPEKIDPRKR